MFIKFRCILCRDFRNVIFDCRENFVGSVFDAVFYSDNKVLKVNKILLFYARIVRPVKKEGPLPTVVKKTI